MDMSGEGLYQQQAF